MFGDYGYVEEGHIEKTYDIRLLKKLAPYAASYRKTIYLTLFLVLVAAILDLAAPYFTKIAIDRYILASWYAVNVDVLSNPNAESFVSKYPGLAIKSLHKDIFFVSHLDRKKIDPADLYAYESNNTFKDKYYKFHEVNKNKLILDVKDQDRIIRMSDGSFMIPMSMLENMSDKDIAEIRADDMRGVVLAAVIFLVILVVLYFVNYYGQYLLEQTGQLFMQNLRLDLFLKIQSKSFSFFDRNPVGRLVNRVTNDIENLNELFRSVLVTVFKDIFFFIGIMSVLLFLNWRLALVCFTILPFIIGITILLSTKAREVFRELRSTVSRINSFLQERLSGMRVIHLFAREDAQIKKFRHINHKSYLAGVRQIKVFALFMPVMELLSSFGVALVIWYGGGKVISEQLSLGELVAFISYIQMFFRPIRDIAEKYNIMQSAMASTERIFEFIDDDDTAPDPENPVSADNINGHIIFKNVFFSYDKENPVLKDISFEIKPGETVAVVGATGSGKTTLVSLIERFYDPDSGQILLDNVDLRNYRQKDIRQNIGLCLQDVFIFAGDLSENISLARENIDMNAVHSSARAVNAYNFISKLPDGFGHKLTEGGATLSGGERQLLSFARALSSNPKILILDEATSSIDPETEGLIQEAFSRMTEKRTTLVVAHRVSTVRNADRILVMHKGRLVETGTHEELMNMKGIYSKLCQLSIVRSGYSI